jgi:hypothetical protein
VKRKDLVGMMFGKLTVLRFSHIAKNRAYWACRCECGKEKIKCGHDLLAGHTKSCGCLKRETMLRIREVGLYRNGGKTDSGGYIKVMCKGHPRADHGGYVFEHILVAEKALGEYIPEGHVIHHINGNKSDNRLENLWWFPSSVDHLKHHAELRRNHVK